MKLPSTLFNGLSEAPLAQLSAVSGGSINDCYHLILADHQEFFLKVNELSEFPHMFQKEASGLALLRKAGALTPEVFTIVEEEEHQYLLLSWHPPGGETATSHQEAGISLARMHQIYDTHFGLDHDNYMGSLEQKNDRYTEFMDFWANCRIIPLVEKCRDLTYLSRSDTQQIERILSRTNEIIPETKPSLIHGDLWSGNFHPSGGKIMLIDPAVAFSHPEADLAMMHLFGKPATELMHAYIAENLPVQGFEKRFDFFNIYPLLVHLILFGAPYYADLKEKLKRIS